MFRRTPPPPDPTVIGQSAGAANVRTELVFLSAQVQAELEKFDALIRDTDWRVKEHDE